MAVKERVKTVVACKSRSVTLRPFALLLLTLLVGCTRQAKLKAPDAESEIIAVMKSDLPPEKKAELAKAIIERAESRGHNWAEIAKEIFMITAGVIGLAK